MEMPSDEQALFDSLRGLEGAVVDPQVKRMMRKLKKENLHLQDLAGEAAQSYAEKVIVRVNRELGRIGTRATFSGKAFVPPLPESQAIHGLDVVYRGIMPRRCEAYRGDEGVSNIIQLHHRLIAQTNLDHTPLGKGEKGEAIDVPVAETTGIEFVAMSNEQAQAITRELYPEIFHDIMQLVEDSERVSTFVCNLSNVKIPAPIEPRHLTAVRQTIASCIEPDTEVPYRAQLSMHDESHNVRKRFDGYAQIINIETDRKRDGYHRVMINLRLLGEAFGDPSQDVIVSPDDIRALYEGREGIKPHWPVQEQHSNS